MEIVVVIGILALLAAILTPVLARARTESKRTACAERLHGFGVGVKLYEGDHDDTPPRIHTGEDPKESEIIFAEFLPYLRSPEMVTCPEPFDPTSPGVRTSLYCYRYTILLGAGPPRVYTFRLQPTNILAECVNHTRGSDPRPETFGFIGAGVHLFVRDDLSTGRVDASRIALAWYGPHGWATTPTDPQNPGANSIGRFPSEPWPLEPRF